MSKNAFVVLGGGISGLSCAYYLQKLGKSALGGRKIVVVEASKHLGGWLRTERCEDGVIHELGPRSIRFAGKLGVNTLNMVEDIGLTHEVVGVPMTHPAAGKRYIWTKGEMNKLPSGIISMFFKRPPLSKSMMHYAIQEYKMPKLPLADDEDISVHEFVKLRFGQELADYFSDPLVRGITGGDARKLSMRALFGEIFHYERVTGSVVRGFTQKPPYAPTAHIKVVSGDLAATATVRKWTMWNLLDGLQRLPEALCTYLLELEDKPVEIYNETAVKKVVFQGPGRPTRVVVESPDGEITLDADQVFSGLSAPQLAAVLPPTLGRLRQKLDSIKAVSMGVVCLEYEGKKVLRPDAGFGYLVPSFEKDSRVLGMTYDSCLFPGHDAQEDITRVTAMLGGEWFEELFGPAATADQDKVASYAQEAAQKHLGFKTMPTRVITRIHKDCLPQYRLNHVRLVEEIKREIASDSLNLQLLGASYSGVAVNEVIMNSRRVVQELFDSQVQQRASQTI